ncbi:SIR2 family protein [Intestinimonas butyriciproducens]|uniref:SIR2 family protein n=1 Tax=Intestinimonas butyriciproducens TaxID=1297617 RepID=UPI00195EB634|nr:SIR2 family protein [Intestinimonas butyriciproducens]MBM6977142.1 SIR2 family protein [Intestinimonas butyriciproducens]
MCNRENREMTSDIKRLITMIRNKEIVLWAGSGLSLYAGYPSGNKFCEIICNAAKTKEDREILLTHKSVLMNVAEEFEQLYSRDALISLVATHFDKVPKEKPYAHYLCTQIPQIDTIITTNYDHLFEYVYGNRIRTIVGTQYKPAGKEPVTLYKIHGDTSNSASVVLTSKDYAKFYEGLNSLTWSNLKVILSEHSVLFIGYSLEDKNIEDIFEKVLIQIDTSKSEFFIAVPSLAEHKLRHFNTICKTTHLPISGERLLSIIEKEIRENVVFDAIDKKISIDQAQAVTHKYGIEPTWTLKPTGGCTEIEIENYVTNPFNALLKINGAQISSIDEETYSQMEKFMDDCDCREIILPSESVRMFEQINGIKIPQKIFINAKKPDIVKLEKPEQIDKVILTVNGKKICGDPITLRSFWGNKRKRVSIELSSIDLSLLYTNESIDLTFTFNVKHTPESALQDLSILSMWYEGSTLMFCRKIGEAMEPAVRLPPLEDKAILKNLRDFISENKVIYQQMIKVESYTNKKFLITSPLTIEEQNSLLKILSIFEPVNVYGIFNLNLTLKCDHALFKMLQPPTTGAIDMTEDIDEVVEFFGCRYIIKERKTHIDSPVIDNINDVKSMLDAGQEAVAKIVSSTGKLIMRCKC